MSLGRERTRLSPFVPGYRDRTKTVLTAARGRQRPSRRVREQCRLCCQRTSNGMHSQSRRERVPCRLQSACLSHFCQGAASLTRGHVKGDGRIGVLDCHGSDISDERARMAGAITLLKLERLGDAEILIAGSIDGSVAAWYTASVPCPTSQTKLFG